MKPQLRVISLGFFFQSTYDRNRKLYFIHIFVNISKILTGIIHQFQVKIIECDFICDYNFFLFEGAISLSQNNFFPLMQMEMILFPEHLFVEFLWIL